MTCIFSARPFFGAGGRQYGDNHTTTTFPECALFVLLVTPFLCRPAGAGPRSRCTLGERCHPRRVHIVLLVARQRGRGRGAAPNQSCRLRETLLHSAPQATWPCAGAVGRGLHSSTSQLNLSAFCGIRGARRGCVARVKGGYGVFRVCRVFHCVRHGSS
jgi:hypothetical protein